MARLRNQDIEEKLYISEDLTGKKQKQGKLPVWRKVCFAVGGAPYQMTNTVIGFFLSIFLLEIAELPPAYVSVIVFGGKVWDAITDPLCGYLVNRTDTRFGKYRPWILLSTPFACVTYFFMWYVPDFSDEGKTAYYFVMFCFFQGLLTGLHVPYTSLTMSITGDQEERDSITAYRMVSEAIGVLAGAVGQGFLIDQYRTAGECEESTPSPQQLADQKWTYTIGAIVMSSIYFVCSLTVFFGSKEIKGLVKFDKDGYFDGLKSALTYRPYYLLCSSFLFLSLAIQIVQGSLALYVTHTLNMGDEFSTMMLVLLSTSICTIPFWQRMLLKFGKKSAYAAGMIIFIPVLMTQLYVTDDPYMYYVILVFAGFSVAVSLLLPWSMITDVLDEYMLDTGNRKDAIFYSFYVFFNKLAVGCALGLSQVFLAIGGYESGKCKQPASVGLALRCLITPGPVIFVLIALIILWKYPIDETRRKKIRDIMEQRRKEALKKSQHTEEKPYRDPIPPDIVTSASYESIGTTDTSTKF